MKERTRFTYIAFIAAFVMGSCAFAARPVRAGDIMPGPRRMVSQTNGDIMPRPRSK